MSRVSVYSSLLHALLFSLYQSLGNSDSFCCFLCIRAWTIQIHSVLFFVSELGQFRFIPVRRSVDSEWAKAKEQCNAHKNDSIIYLLNGYIAFDFMQVNGYIAFDFIERGNFWGFSKQSRISVECSEAFTRSSGRTVTVVE
jgi:hypothetical protein